MSQQEDKERARKLLEALRSVKTIDKEGNKAPSEVDIREVRPKTKVG